jgi:hypothetical protein
LEGDRTLINRLFTAVEKLLKREKGKAAREVGNAFEEFASGIVASAKNTAKTLDEGVADQLARERLQGQLEAYDHVLGVDREES